MAPKVRSHLPADAPTPATLIPKHLTKQEFGKRLYKLMLAKGWHQSELARQADVARDAVSTYIRGKSLPTPVNLQALANALDVAPDELLPNITEAAIDEDDPSFEIKTSTSAQGKAWIRVNRLVTVATALKIGELLENDRVHDRE